MSEEKQCELHKKNVDVPHDPEISPQLLKMIDKLIEMRVNEAIEKLESRLTNKNV